MQAGDCFFATNTAQGNWIAGQFALVAALCLKVMACFVKPSLVVKHLLDRWLWNPCLFSNTSLVLSNLIFVIQHCNDRCCQTDFLLSSLVNRCSEAQSTAPFRPYRLRVGISAGAEASLGDHPPWLDASQYALIYITYINIHATYIYIHDLCIYLTSYMWVMFCIFT